MSKENHKIDADDRKIFDVLNERKYTVDYFQREYSWEQKHIAQLVTDLSSTFLDAYTEGDPRAAVEHYTNYYLGPFVVSSKDGMKSIIDGQQRLTSLTLFLIFLNNLQKELGGKESIEPLIFSEKYGQKSFNIQVEERRPCLEKLFLTGSYEVREEDDESTRTMALRYTDIAEAFPDELKGKAFPYFLDWLKYNVVLVEITAYSDDNAYTIFEAMNDRGKNLNATEMLKGYVLSRFADTKDREKANRFWKASIQELHTQNSEEDQTFFQAWLRSQYADTIRQGKAGSSNEDFEKIGTKFHSWFRDNLDKAGLSADAPEDFHRFVHVEMKFYLHAHLQILQAQRQEMPGWEHVFYHYQWGVADSLCYPLMLSPLKSTDPAEVVRQKINAVARYLEAFAVRRAVNFRKFGASSIRYTMYSLVKELRGKDLETLKATLRKKLEEMEESWDGLANFRLHAMNGYFVKFLLSRITGYIEQQSGASTSFTTYFISPGTKPYQVEHIWANKFEEHRDEFEQQHEFDTYRNRIGDLVLLPQGTNQSYGAMPYATKVDHYLKENLLAKSLHPSCYQNNPNFVGMAGRLGLQFKPHLKYAKADIDERQRLVQRICEVIWNGE
ncbi:DUF262 domain-containing protein [Verrucomicrobium sp. BvORR106]|uniref:DUF262 domain-containing protein n=1 Tax=Verrucomicrobium sp. BvORR106 TaxID=1403819 RepID=UPI00056E66BD|nr:DUF262 domain-containing protein [Verrucomicrobium sp. BvORR106]